MKRLFDPVELTPTDQGDTPQDRDKGVIYRYPPGAVIAVNVAIATGRPMLLRGRPGTGKSTLAKNVAKQLGAFYTEEVVTSRTRAQDLRWKVDALARLADAHSDPDTARDLANYIEPGALWWAFQPEEALAFMEARQSNGGEAPARLKRRREHLDALESARGGASADGTLPTAVVLLDEIDKADPDVPNDLLGALGSLRFWVEPLDLEVSAQTHPMVFITTNEERELPAAFVRRCVVLHLDTPDEDVLVTIAKAHYRGRVTDKDDLLHDLARRFVAERERVQARDLSTAEFLDAVDACLDLDLDPTQDEDTWSIVSRVVLAKVQQ